jgi:hypothetical protein
MITASCDNPQDAKRLPHGITISPRLVDMDIAHEDEDVDALKSEVVDWIKDNISRGGARDFFIHFDAEVTEPDPQTGEPTEVTPTYFLVRFKRWKDALNFKMRWY